MKKVMIIEDEFLTRKGLIRTIPWAEHGCEVIGEAADGQEGLRLAKQLRPDIVVTDIHMPGVDGLEMIAELKESLQCEFIVFSGYSQFEYAKKALELGVRAYLLKPVDDDELLHILDETVEAINQRRQYDKLRERPVDQEKNSIYQFRYLEKDGSNCGERYLEKAIHYIAEHYMENLTGKSVADTLGISESYLSKLFRRHTSYSFLEFLTMHRVSVAMDLLEKTDYRTYQIADMVGYKDQRYFSDIFKKIVGVTPTQYRNQ